MWPEGQMLTEIVMHFIYNWGHRWVRLILRAAWVMVNKSKLTLTQWESISMAQTDILPGFKGPMLSSPHPAIISQSFLPSFVNRHWNRTLKKIDINPPSEEHEQIPYLWNTIWPFIETIYGNSRVYNLCSTATAHSLHLPALVRLSQLRMENPQNTKRGSSRQTPARLIYFCVFLSIVVCLSFALSFYSFKRVLSLDKEFHSINELKVTGEEHYASSDSKVTERKVSELLIRTWNQKFLNSLIWGFPKRK